MDNFLIIAILAVLLGATIFYIVRAKRRGVKCIGCPAGGTCGKGAQCAGCKGGCGAVKEEK